MRSCSSVRGSTVSTRNVRGSSIRASSVRRSSVRRSSVRCSRRRYLGFRTSRTPLTLRQGNRGRHTNTKPVYYFISSHPLFCLPQNSYFVFFRPLILYSSDLLFCILADIFFILADPLFCIPHNSYVVFDILADPLFCLPQNSYFVFSQTLYSVFLRTLILYSRRPFILSSSELLFCILAGSDLPGAVE